jgi:predicted AlkP superfamily pyrophosphatase or phosphodiesterase
MIRIHLFCLLLLTLIAGRAESSPKAKPVEQIERALIISIDGLRPDLLLRGDTPHIHRLFEGGSYTFWARTTAASTTLPSHMSMLTGVVPEVHGIMWNADLPLAEPVHPLRPTLFELARQAGYTTAMASGKSKFDIFGKPGTLDWQYFPSTPTGSDLEVVSQAQRMLREHRPEVMLVHLPDTDSVGHSKGWGSTEQMTAIARADECVGTLLSTLEELKLRESTVVLITADHGGAGRTHGPEDARSRTIPWIINGPGIRENYDLTRLPDLDIETFDTFTTACTLLGIPVERRVRGKFVAAILKDQQLLQPGAAVDLPAPSTAPAGGM